MRTIDAIAVHHSASLIGTLTWDRIRSIHVSERGFRDVGYHFGVWRDRSSGEFVVRLGRDTADTGAHVRGHNKHTIGVCFEGNFEEEEMPFAELQVGSRLVAELCERFSLNDQRIIPHRDFTGAATLCPGARFPIHGLRGLIRDYEGWV